MAQATLVHFYQTRTFLLELLSSTCQGLVSLNYGRMVYPSCTGNWVQGLEQGWEGDYSGKSCVSDCPDPELSGGHPATSHPMNIPWPLLVSAAAFCVISKTKQNKMKKAKQN